MPQDLAQGDVADARPEVRRIAAEQGECLRIRRSAGPEARFVGVLRIETVDEACLECGTALARARAACLSLGGPRLEGELCERGQGLLGGGQVLGALG